jgi:hypothetical protein
MQQDMLADYRRPGRPKGSRDRVPRKHTANHAVSISNIHSSMEIKGSTALEPFWDGRIHIIEELEIAEQTPDNSLYQECLSCSSKQPIPQNDPFHADWLFW